ncbi:MAG: L-rhamnose mutarotase [Bacteroidota bacterium]
MERITFRLQLNEGYKEEYELRHNPIWQELESEFLENGVREYSIFIDDETNELFGVINVESKELWKRISNSDVVAKWREHMKEFYETDEKGTPKLKRMREVFHIKK